MKLYDLFGTLISLLSTYYFIRIDIKAWPIGILATVLNGWLYWENGIYADMFLQVFYFISFIYGWHHWSKINTHKARPIQHLSLQHTIYLFLGIIILYLIVFFILNAYSYSAITKTDMVAMGLSLIAQGLLCSKIITNWILWFTADMLYASLYYSKNLPFHTLLAIFYAVLALHGYYRWRKQSSLSLIPTSLKQNVNSILS